MNTLHRVLRQQRVGEAGARLLGVHGAGFLHAHGHALLPPLLLLICSARWVHTLTGRRRSAHISEAAVCCISHPGEGGWG